MKAVIQRVTTASVTVNNQIISQISKGLCVLIGIATTDTQKDMDYIITKLLTLRLFNDPENTKPWSKSVVDIGGEVLCVSQFTLFALTDKGKKPDFHLAMPGERSKGFYEEFLVKLRHKYMALVDKDLAGLNGINEENCVRDGEFGAMMNVSIQNDGPVTIQIDSRKSVYKDELE